MILITGGSQGIGRDLVLDLARSGQDVVFTYRSGEDRARQVEAECGGKARAFPLDLADPQGPDRLMTALHESELQVHHLANNAGETHGGLLAMTSDGSLEAASRLLDHQRMNCNGLYGSGFFAEF